MAILKDGPRLIAFSNLHNFKNHIKFVFFSLVVLSGCSEDWGSTHIEGVMIRADSNQPVANQLITVHGFKERKGFLWGTWGAGNEQIITTHETSTDSLGRFTLAIERNKDVFYYGVRVENTIDTPVSNRFWCDPPQVFPSDSLEPEKTHSIIVSIVCPTYVFGVVKDQLANERAGIEVIVTGFATDTEILRLSDVTDEEGRFYFPVPYDENLTSLTLTIIDQEFNCAPSICDNLVVGEQNDLEIMLDN